MRSLMGVYQYIHNISSYYVVIDGAYQYIHNISSYYAVIDWDESYGVEKMHTFSAYVIGTTIW